MLWPDRRKELRGLLQAQPGSSRKKDKGGKPAGTLFYNRGVLQRNRTGQRLSGRKGDFDIMKIEIATAVPIK